MRVVAYYKLPLVSKQVSISKSCMGREEKSESVAEAESMVSRDWKT